MKKLLYLFGAMALMAGMVACGPDEGGNVLPDLDNITLDGFYVYGEAVGANTTVVSENMMSPGSNEVEKAKRGGMYEKYIWLEANKDFELVEYKAGELTRYSAELAVIDYSQYDENPAINVFGGALLVGDDAPAMQVSESGLYHIIFDTNAAKDLEKAQIIVVPAKFGVRGGMNGWGFTQAENTYTNTMEVAEDGTITWTWNSVEVWTDADEDGKDDNLTDYKALELAKGGEFKFAYAHAWKINLDAGGTVKAEISLGSDLETEDGLHNSLADNNIVVDKAGKYEIKLVFKKRAGEVGDSFTYSAVCTEESTMPETMYIIGDAVGGWTWGTHDVAMVPVHSEPGKFWAVRYIADATKGFKFCPVQEWNGDFTGLETNSGYNIVTGDDGGSNCYVETAGLYTFIVDLVAGSVSVAPAKIYGMGPCFSASGSDWKGEAALFTVNADGTATINVDNASKLEGSKDDFGLRMYVPTGKDWWHSEFNVIDGKIVYRADGGDLPSVAVTAGQTVTLDFNAGTGTIQ